MKEGRMSVGRVGEYFVKDLKRSFFVSYLKTQPLRAFGVCVVIMSVILAVIAPLIVPYPPTIAQPGNQLLPPSAEHWFGTDVNGMDVFSRTICAYRMDLSIAVIGIGLAILVGVPIGVFAGYFDGKGGVNGAMSQVILRIMDVFQAFPVFVLALVLVAALGPSVGNVILVVFVTNIPATLRLTRSEILTLRERPFAEAARASGNSDLRIALYHLMPNALTPVLALASVVMGFAILLTAGLSFVGAGIRVPTPEWGSMIAIGAPAIVTGQWWPAVFPGFFMALTIFSFSLVGDTITVLVDPLERVRFGYRK